MLYCDECKKENDWPSGFVASMGGCVVCGVIGKCTDVPSSQLPRFTRPKGENGFESAPVVFARCIDNLGLEDRFEFGEEYRIEGSYEDDDLVYAWDMFGQRIEVFRDRFGKHRRAEDGERPWGTEKTWLLDMNGVPVER